MSTEFSQTLAALAGTPPPTKRTARPIDIQTALARAMDNCAGMGAAEQVLAGVGAGTTSRIAALSRALEIATQKGSHVSAPRTPAATTPAPSPSPASAQSAPTPTAPAAITFQQFRAMSSADQQSFCRDGAAMCRDEFLAMPSRSQSAFLSYGGKIVDSSEPDAPKTKNPPAGSMWRKDFEKLSPKAQSEHFRLRRKIHD